MKRKAGIWVDHRKAVIVIISEVGEEIKEITSNMEKRVRFSDGNSSEDGPMEDVRDRKFGNHLNNYYDSVIACIKDVETVQIFGPGEAKGELEKRLKEKGFKGQLVALETTDKMTDPQISAKVRAYFQT
jgi:hypothetical protein